MLNDIRLYQIERLLGRYKTVFYSDDYGLYIVSSLKCPTCASEVITDVVIVQIQLVGDLLSFQPY